MKRFLSICASLLAFYVLFAWAYDGCALWLMRHSPSCAATKIERGVKGGEGEEVAIFGSSRALGNYVPSALSASAFNYGIDGMSLNEALFLADLYLQRNPTDSTVIINLDPWGFAEPGTVRLVGDYRLAGRDSSVRKSIPGLSLSWTDWMPGFRFQGMLRGLLSHYLNTRWGYSKRVDNGAELLRDNRTEEEWAVMKSKLKPYSFFCDPQCEEQVASLYAKQGRHRIVWVVTPISSVHHALHANPSDMRAFLSRQARHSNVSAINLFDAEADYPDSFFTDPIHLNVSGAEKFTQALKPQLPNQLLFEPR